MATVCEVKIVLTWPLDVIVSRDAWSRTRVCDARAAASFMRVDFPSLAISQFLLLSATAAAVCEVTTVLTWLLDVSHLARSRTRVCGASGAAGACAPTAPTAPSLATSHSLRPTAVSVNDACVWVK